MRLIDADAFIAEMNERIEKAIKWGTNAIADRDTEIRLRAEQAVATFCEASLTAKKMPTIEERKTDGFTTWEKSVADSYRIKDIIQKFHDYQVEWLKSHYDIELEPLLEEMIVRFLHDTANCYMMEAQS